LYFPWYEIETENGNYHFRHLKIYPENLGGYRGPYRPKIESIDVEFATCEFVANNETQDSTFFSQAEIQNNNVVNDFLMTRYEIELEDILR